MRLYIDPGTGSMLFTILIGVLGTAAYFLRNAAVKLRFLMSGGSKEKSSFADKIPFVIFTDSKRYWNLFEPICDEFEKRGIQLSYLTASPDDPALKKEYMNVKCEFIGEGNRAFARMNFLNAGIVLSTTPNLDVYQWKRSKNVKRYVFITHSVRDMTGYKMFGTDYYDSLIVSGEYQVEQIRKLESLRNLPEKEVKVIGVPYLDAMKRRLDSCEELTKHETTVLLAPSWGSSALLGKYGDEIINALIDTGYHIVIRPHPQSYTAEKDMLDRLMKNHPESDTLEWNRDNDNFEILRRSDIMISDFSGVIFDYAMIFEKPVIYTDTSFDNSTYDASWLDEEMWTFKTLPKIGRLLKHDDFAFLKEIISDMLINPEYLKAIEEARSEAWANIGHSAELTADYLLEMAEKLNNESI